MHPLYRAWWQALMDLRPLVRFLAERFPKVAPWAIRLRSVGHVLIGNPLQTLVGVDALLLWHLAGWPARPLAIVVALVFVGLEVGHRASYRSGGWWIGWREAWRFRRRWPADWAGVAAKTVRVQAEVGTSKEPIASAVLRPVADHPKLSWWPRIEWPVVWWWVGPPPGRSLAALDELGAVLAANISRASDIEVDYERDNDSHGRLVVSFADILGEPSTPAWTTGQPIDPAGPGAQADDLTAALEAFEAEPVEVFPPLRVVEEGDAS